MVLYPENVKLCSCGAINQNSNKRCWDCFSAFEVAQTPQTQPEKSRTDDADGTTAQPISRPP